MYIVELFSNISDWLFHLDKYLALLVNNFGAWTYFILFLVIFGETGLVIFPFLPGDGLLFAVGIFSQNGTLHWNVWLTSGLLILAAIIGNTANYHISVHLGDYIHSKLKSEKWDRNIKKTHDFMDKYGGASLIIARFIPIARTYGPFVAGMTKMNYWQFQLFNTIGAILWVGICVGMGYGLGKTADPHYSFLVLLALATLATLVPAGIKYAYHKYKASQNKSNE